MEYIYVVTIAFLFFFSFSMMVKREKSLSEKIFVAWVFLLMLNEFTFFLDAKGLMAYAPYLFSVLCDVHILHGILLLLYVESFIDAGFKLQKKHLLYLLPLLIISLLKFIYNQVLGVIDCYGDGGCMHENNPYIQSLTLLKMMFLGGCVYFSRRIVQTTKPPADARPIDKVRHSWISNITFGTVILFAFVALFRGLSMLGIELLADHVTFYNVLVSIFIWVFLYLGNSYAYLFVAPIGISNGGMALDTPDVEKVTIVKSGVPDEQLETIYVMVMRYLNAEAPHLKGQLTLGELSRALQSPQNQISQAINSKSGRNYSDFINSLRVEALIEKLKNPANRKYTIWSLAMDCGFTSKASFNRVFKQYTGATPSDYQKTELK